MILHFNPLDGQVASYKRIAIAKFDGWTCCGVNGGIPYGLAPHLKLDNYSLDDILNHDVPICEVPKYGLDELHLVEKKLQDQDPAKWNRYVDKLFNDAYDSVGDPDFGKLINLSAQVKIDAIISVL